MGHVEWTLTTKWFKRRYFYNTRNEDKVIRFQSLFWRPNPNSKRQKLGSCGVHLVTTTKGDYVVKLQPVDEWAKNNTQEHKGWRAEDETKYRQVLKALG